MTRVMTTAPKCSLTGHVSMIFICGDELPRSDEDSYVSDTDRSQINSQPQLCPQVRQILLSPAEEICTRTEVSAWQIGSSLPHRKTESMHRAPCGYRGRSCPRKYIVVHRETATPTGTTDWFQRLRSGSFGVGVVEKQRNDLSFPNSSFAEIDDRY